MSRRFLLASVSPIALQLAAQAVSYDDEGWYGAVDAGLYYEDTRP